MSTVRLAHKDELIKSAQQKREEQNEDLYKEVFKDLKLIRLEYAHELRAYPELIQIR